MAQAKGIDISRYNERGDWQTAKAAGISFAIIKAGGIYSVTGKCYSDSLLPYHVTDARAAGVPFGLYWYFLPFAPVVNQFDYYMGLVTKYAPDIPHLFVDIESSNGQDSRAMTLATKAFITLCLGTGRKVINYTRESFWDINVISDPLWQNCELWASRWSSRLTSPWSDGYYKFRDWSDWRMWQYSGDNNALARQYGFSRGDPDIDLNIFNGDENLFRSWAGLEHIPTLEERVVDLERRVNNLEANK